MSSHTDSFFDSKSGRAVIVAFDYGINGTVNQEAKNPGATMAKFISGKPTGVLSSPVLIHRFASLYKENPSVVPIATVDALTRLPAMSAPMQIFELDRAIELGARAVKCILIAGQKENRLFLENLRYVARLGEQAAKRRIPFVVEAVNWGTEIPEEKKTDPEEVHKVCRIAFELGAEIIKTEYTGDPESFRELASCLPVPICILGGSRGKVEDIFQKVRDAVDAGAKGVVFGRNIYKAEDPAKMVRVLNSLVHNNTTAAEAVAMMSQ